MSISLPLLKAPRPSSASPDQKKLCSSVVRRPMVFSRRVPMMQPTTNRQVMATEPIEAQSPFRLSAPSTFGAKAYTANTGITEQVQNMVTNSMRLP
ncbi:hypothetical protein D3C77_602060 [compost metagenome]